MAFGRFMGMLLLRMVMMVIVSVMSASITIKSILRLVNFLAWSSWQSSINQFVVFKT